MVLRLIILASFFIHQELNLLPHNGCTLYMGIVYDILWLQYVATYTTLVSNHVLYSVHPYIWKILVFFLRYIGKTLGIGEKSIFYVRKRNQYLYDSQIRFTYQLPGVPYLPGTDAGKNENHWFLLKNYAVLKILVILIIWKK